MTVLLVNWQTQKADAAFGQNGIPGDSIRIRIIANSDTIQDQAIKRVISDRVADELNGWVAEPSDLNEARAAIREHLPEIERLVGRLLATRGFAYGYSVELGKVEFPDKMFASRLYPAGDYEALRITLGKGEGQNWWCVLFPPLCFADAVAKKEDGSSLKQAVLTKKAADDKASLQAAQAGSANKGSGGKTGVQQAEGAQKVDSAQKAEGAQKADDAQKAEGTQKADSAQKADGAQKTDSAQKVDGAQKADSAQKVDSAQKADGGKLGAGGGQQEAAATAAADSRPKAKFFLWELLKDLFRAIRHLFR